MELFFLLQSMALNAIHALLSDLQGESNPPVGIACQTQRSAVELHDLPRKAQPDARKRADEQSSTGRKHLAKILSLDAKP